MEQVTETRMCESCQDREVYDDERYCEDCAWIVEMPDSVSTRIVTCRRIVAEHQFEKIDGYVVDATTASLLVTVYDALAPKNRARFDSIPLPRLVDFCWKQVKR